MCLAVPGKILETEERDGSRIAKVQFGGITRQAFLNFVPEAAIGDYVMVHAVSYTHLDVYKRQVLVVTRSRPESVARAGLSMQPPE